MALGSHSKLLLFTVSFFLTFLACSSSGEPSSASSSAKLCFGGDYQYIDLYPLFLFHNLCVHSYFTPRKQENSSSLEISFSYSGIVYGKEIIFEYNSNTQEEDHSICIRNFPTGFYLPDPRTLCLEFKDIFVSDSWAQICPKFTVKSRSGTETSYDQIACFSLGEDDFDDVAQIVASSNNFAFNLLNSNLLTEANVSDLFVSPFSIANGLVMALMAAQSTTAEQIMNGLNFTADIKREIIFESFSSIVSAMEHSHSVLQLENRLWIGQDWYSKISSQYIKDFSRFGKIESCDFQKRAQLETIAIDEYIAESTHGMIEQVLNHDLSVNTLLLFTNIMHFSAEWSFPFMHTIKQEFIGANADKEPSTVKMMFTNKSIKVNHYSDSEVELIELPFKSDVIDISFLMIRPSFNSSNTADSLSPSSTIDFEKKLTRNLLKHWMSKMQMKTLENGIALPVLSMYNIQEITPALKQMGITNLFDAEKCNLGGLLTDGGKIRVSESVINRQSVLELSMSGIKIATVTTDGETASDNEDQGDVMHADLPFLFLIMDRAKDLILFAGRVTNPEGWKIYISEKENEKNDHHMSRAGIILLVLSIVMLVIFFLAKYVYNVQVLELDGLDAVPCLIKLKDCGLHCYQYLYGIEIGDIGVPKQDDSTNDVDEEVRYEAMNDSL